MRDFDLGSLEVSNSGLDAFLGNNPEVVTPLAAGAKSGGLQGRPVSKTAASRIKVASLAQLAGFIRTAEDTLVHKSDRDLWSLRKDGHGEFYIERMFDDAGVPLKG